MQFFISDQWQPRFYLASFSHNTCMTHGQTDGRTHNNHRCAIQHSCSSGTSKRHRKTNNGV